MAQSYNYSREVYRIADDHNERLLCISNSNFKDERSSCSCQTKIFECMKVLLEDFFTRRGGQKIKTCRQLFSIPMDGIHLPDIGKLGLHVATDMQIRRKVAPWNMAESNRLKHYSKRLENERYERRRDLNRQVDRMRRKGKVLEKNRRALHSERIPRLNKNKQDSKDSKSVKLPPIVLDKCMSQKRRKSVAKSRKPAPKEIYTFNFRYSISVEHEDGISLLHSGVGNMEDVVNAGHSGERKDQDAASVTSFSKSGRDSSNSVVGRNSPQDLSVKDFVDSPSGLKRNNLVPPSTRILPPISLKANATSETTSDQKISKDSDQNLHSDFKMLSVKKWVTKHS